MEDSQGLYLVLIEADKIQDYIFQTGKLKEGIGGSFIIYRFNRWDVYKILFDYGENQSPQLKRNIIKSGSGYVKEDKKILQDAIDYELIYSGGGNVKILFKDPLHAEQTAKELIKSYRLATLSADATKVIEEFRQTESLNDVIPRAERKIRQAKLAKNFPHYPFTAPHFKLCSSCGAKPALTTDADDFLCASCAKKRQVGERPDVFREFQEFLWNAFSPKTQQSLQAEGTFDINDFLPREFDHIADARNFLAVVVIDGNRFGKKIEEVLKNLPASERNLDKETYLLSEFSSLVDILAREALAKATAKAFEMACLRTTLKQYKKEIEVKGYKTERIFLPFRPIILGGDDLTFVCAADKAMAIVQGFAERLNEESKKYPCLFGSAGLNCGIGLAIVKKNFPFRSAHRLAEELVKSAKDKSRQYLYWKEREVSALDFTVVTTSSVESLYSSRKREYLYQQDGFKYLLTGRPYVISYDRHLNDEEERRESLEDFIQQTQKLYSCLAANKFKSLRKIMREGKATSQYRWIMMCYRLDTKEREKLREVIEFYGELWRDSNYDGEAVCLNNFIDMVEIFDYLP